MGFMSRNLPAPRMMMSKMKQLRRARHEEAMLNLQISQQLKQEQEQQTMMMKTTTTLEGENGEKVERGR